MLVGKVSLYRYFVENHSLTDMSKERDRALVKTHINNQNIVNYCQKILQKKKTQFRGELCVTDDHKINYEGGS